MKKNSIEIQPFTNSLTRIGFLTLYLFVFTALHSQKPLPVLSETYVELNKIIYTGGDELSAVLYPGVKTAKLFHPFLVIASEKTKDVEVLKLVSRVINGENVFIAQKKLKVILKTGITDPRKGDGILSLAPGETFYCIYYPKDSSSAGRTKEPDMIFDFGWGEDKAIKTSPTVLIPELALTMDEKRMEGKNQQIGTVTIDKGLPLQLAATQLIFYPNSKSQLSKFLQLTNGRIIGRNYREEKSAGNNRPAYLVEVDLSKVNSSQFSQLRTAWGLTDKVYCSNKEVIKLMTLTFQCLLDGYAVTVNPRMQFMDNDSAPFSYTRGINPPITASGRPLFPTERVAETFSDPLFNIAQVWSFMAVWDKDESVVNVGMIDQGFFPNKDFRGFPNNIHQCDVTTSFLNVGGFSTADCGPHKAEGIPTVANSLLSSSWSWHGSAIATISGGQINNDPLLAGEVPEGTRSRFQSCAGTGGQVVQPFLYKVNLSTYAFHIGQSIKAAVDDKASVINLSMGYPCKIVTKIFGWTPGICTIEDRRNFCTTITATLFGTATAICAVAPIIDALTFGLGGGIAACAAANLAAITASAACYSTLLEGDVKGIMQEGVDYALDHGVTIVACAGNDLNTSTNDIIKKIIDLDQASQRVELWEIIPANLPGVICVGASGIRSENFTNKHFWGNRVDVWAPIRSLYVAPDIAGSDPDPAALLKFESLGGTSAAAPYITGLVADMQAIDPSLNPNTNGLTDIEKKAIPGKIAMLLRNTAFTNAELTAMQTSFNDSRRRNLVNPLRLLFETSRNVLPDFAGLNYGTEFNFDNREWDGTYSMNDNTPMTANPITNNAKGTIANFPSKGQFAEPILDTDYYYWQPPTAVGGTSKGVYRNGGIEMRTPAGFGELLINDDQLLLSSTIENGEVVKKYSIPPIVEGDGICIGGNSRPQYMMQIKGKPGRFIPDDNIYKLSITEPVLTDPAPQPDKFDIKNGNNNPKSTDHNNNSPLNGTYIIPSFFSLNAAKDAFETTMAGLNFHDCSDNDWFIVSPVFSASDIGQLSGPQSCSRLTMTISFSPGTDITILQNNISKTITNVSSYTVNYDGEFFFQLKPTSPGEFIVYDLKMSLRKGIDWSCFMKKFPRQPSPNTWIELWRKCLACGIVDGTGVYMVNPYATSPLVKNSRQANNATFLVNWTGKGNFTLVTKTLGGKIRSVSLADREGNFMEELTPYNDDHFMISRENMSPGVYMLVVESGNVTGRSDGDSPQFPKLQIIVPALANFNKSISAEKYLKEHSLQKLK